jgi:CYTH domain-containing protein
MESGMGVEIERKFRLINDSWREQVREKTLLRQGYIANTRRASVRVRLAGEAGLAVGQGDDARTVARRIRGRDPGGGCE